MKRPALPSRYEIVASLGRGGGGEVFSVLDKMTGESLALKTLARDASAHQSDALVREAIALEALEGLGLPKIRQFGRVSKGGQPYLLRELAPGRSLAELIDDRSIPLAALLDAIARAAEQLTQLVRASLLHGDIKPANIIVAPDGRTTLVDLGLAVPYREGGSEPRGLSLRYAAPELLRGEPLSLRTEIHALGATLQEALDAREEPVLKDRDRLAAIARRATAKEPSERFPSADEFASALRFAAKLEAPPPRSPADAWPIVGMDGVAAELLQTISRLEGGRLIAIVGPKGSGRSTLLRRLAWSLGIRGESLAWGEEGEAPEASYVFFDDADLAEGIAHEPIVEALNRGQRVVAVTESANALPKTAIRFSLPPLSASAARSLITRAIPSLPDALQTELLARTDRRPGALRAFVRNLDNRSIVSPAELDTYLNMPAALSSGSDIYRRIDESIEKGRFDEAAEDLQALQGETSLRVTIARARVALGQGQVDIAMRELDLCQKEARKEIGSRDGWLWLICNSRAHLRLGEYAKSERWAEEVLTLDIEPAIAAEALSLLGLCKSYRGESREALGLLEKSIDAAQAAHSPRVESLALASLGFVLQRADDIDNAKDAYRRSLVAAERAEDAGSVATIRLNLAAISQGQGDIAEAISHLEAAIDMGARAGRAATVDQARINLANLDIYLGRYSRAEASLALLDGPERALSRAAQAQVLGLRGFLLNRTGATEEALEHFDDCARVYEELGRGIDSAEAWLEGALVVAESPTVDREALLSRLTRGREALGEASAHGALLAIVQGRARALEGDRGAARERLDEALDIAKAGGQKEWIWRALESRAQLSRESGRELAARRDREEALLVLEEIAAELPPDLREVYWDDPRRKRLREANLGREPTFAISYPDAEPKDDRLARILEINRKLAGVHDLDKLVEIITDHAVALLEADHGFVLLISDDGSIVVQASRARGGDEGARAQFSRSIAERVMTTGEPVVSENVRNDSRLRGFASVHQMMLEAVACAPIRSPKGQAIGALYLETRRRLGVEFAKELSTLSALADQVAIAIENARLLSESAAHAKKLAETNQKLLIAQKKLEEALGHRTAELDRARRDLRTTQEALDARFGYGGLVGRSDAMRRVYALIDRLKDTDVPVLITGESGTGKEMVARAIHEQGSRAKMPFVGLNCGAIPEQLLESELFGHVRGAFTGADRERRGLFREGEKGTILLDEIGEMPHKMQAGLLRVLQEKLVRPVGGVRELPVDVRIIAATNRNLEEMVREGSFREDLFYRLNVVELRLPSLRERDGDIPLLVDHFLGLFAARFRREKRTVSREALRMLSAYSWPGNIRQLENALLNAWISSDESEIDFRDFDLPDSDHLRPQRGSPAPSSARRQGSSDLPPSLSAYREDEKARILRALEETGWNRVKASELLGIPRRTFYRRLKQYGIQ